MMRVVPTQTLPADLISCKALGYYVYARSRAGALVRSSHNSLKSAAQTLLVRTASAELQEAVLSVETLGLLSIRIWVLATWTDGQPAPTVEVHPSVRDELNEWITPLLRNEVPY